MARESLPPIHLGEILLEGFPTPMGISQYRCPRKSAHRNGTSARLSPAMLAKTELG